MPQPRFSCSHLFKFRFRLDFALYKAHVEDIKRTHLRDLMSNTEQCTNLDTLNKLHSLAEAAHLQEKINRMFNGERKICLKHGRETNLLKGIHGCYGESNKK
ncbi:unnamed protein product [Fraxinus pennsylvanica]|uniref:Uncharacterized protein n=1 Tax=Fraxinus pennsylvanica TaxID=56036 RepID=A0AAD1Z9R3_9LAMI|nr:unnamed protein product [Fraxinus pennsylvanica]